MERERPLDEEAWLASQMNSEPEMQTVGCNDYTPKTSTVPILV